MTIFKKNKRFKRTNSCYFTKNGITYIDYKNIELLKKFINKSNELIPHTFTGTKSKYQKHVAKAVKRARFLGLLGYSGQEPKGLIKQKILIKQQPIIETDKTFNKTIKFKYNK